MPDREKVTAELQLLRDFLMSEERKAFKGNNNSAVNVLMHYRNIVIDALALLKERPELVRCRDCKHHGKDTCSAAAGIAYPPPDDWFCADGERKELEGEA